MRRVQARVRAERELAARRARAPAGEANRARNARARRDRHVRWAPLRAAAWPLVQRLIAPGARVAVVGAGNGDTLPLGRIAERAGHLALIDLDPDAAAAARRALPAAHRGRVTVIDHDVTLGAADVILRRAPAAPVRPPEEPLPGAPYDLVIGDLFYSQLLYPALVDQGLAGARIDALTEIHAPALTRGVVVRLQRSAPAGRVLHVHDPIAQWDGHPQPTHPADLAALATRDLDGALARMAAGSGPHLSDPRRALAGLLVPVRETRLWHWPFAEGVDYLACATLVDGG